MPDLSSVQVVETEVARIDAMPAGPDRVEAERDLYRAVLEEVHRPEGMAPSALMRTALTLPK